MKEGIPSKLLISGLSIEGFFVEIKLRKIRAKKKLTAYHLNCIGRSLDSQLGQYETFILMGHFNTEASGFTTKNFCQIYGCLKLLFLWAISMQKQVVSLRTISVKSTVAKISSNIRPVSKTQ